jgi:hypothetical protein
MSRATWMFAAACLCAACAAKVPDLRRTSGVLFATDVGVRVPLYDLHEMDQGEEALELLQGGVALGYRVRGVEAYVQLRAGRTSFLGIEGLYRFSKAPFLLVGGGFGVAATDFEPFEGVWREDVALEIVLPRVDLRLPISPSWELSWTALRLSYLDERLVEDQFDDYQARHGFALMSTVGLAARADRAWENRRLAPRVGGLTFDGNLWLALFVPSASERRDEQIAGDDAMGGDFVQRAAQILRLAPGVSLRVPWGFVEIGLPISYYPVQANGGAGIQLAFRPRTADFLSLGAAVHWFPRGYLLAELPRIDIAIRASDAVDITLTPIALLLAFEPARDVWFEDGIERKMPYWGLVFGLGGRWTVPLKGLARSD